MHLRTLFTFPLSSLFGTHAGAPASRIWFYLLKYGLKRISEEDTLRKPWHVLILNELKKFTLQKPPPLRMIAETGKKGRERGKWVCKGCNIWEDEVPISGGGWGVGWLRRKEGVERGDVPRQSKRQKRWEQRLSQGELESWLSDVTMTQSPLFREMTFHSGLNRFFLTPQSDGATSYQDLARCPGVQVCKGARYVWQDACVMPTMRVYNVDPRG